MPKVILPMRPFGAVAERFDLSPLAQYGAVHFLFDQARAPSLRPTNSLKTMADALLALDFNPATDYICPFSPDSYAAFGAGMIFGAFDFGPELKLLRYDRPVQADGTRAPRGVYVPARVETWPLEGE